MKPSRVVALHLVLSVVFLGSCSPPQAPSESPSDPTVEPTGPPRRLEPEFRLSTENTHNRFSRTIPPALRVPSGAVVEVFTKEASDGQLTPDSDASALNDLDFDPIHPLTGPIYIEGAMPGDVLAVTLHEVEVGEWGWAAVVPGFGFLSDLFPDPYLKTFRFEEGATHARFSDDISLPLAPFPGVMGVAPDTDELLTTIPPRQNGGNMDNKYMTAGTTVYFPVLVEGALFSVGDTHAVQGDGEVGGTAIEAPMRLVVELRVRKGGRRLAEPEYETDEYYAVTGFAETIDLATRKATRYMIDYLVEERRLDRNEAYVLASLAGDLKISEVVDLPHVLVSMHIPKSVLPAPSGDNSP